MCFLVAQLGALCACGCFGIPVRTMVRDLHLSSIVIVVSMAVVNFGVSLVQVDELYGDFVSLVLLVGCVAIGALYRCAWSGVADASVNRVSSSCGNLSFVLNVTLINPWCDDSRITEG